MPLSYDIIKIKNMKILTFFSITVLFWLSSCQKEACNESRIKIINSGSMDAIVYCNPMAYLAPGESATENVTFCNGFDENGLPCGNQIQTSITYQFDGAPVATVPVKVHRCETVVAEIFN